MNSTFRDQRLRRGWRLRDLAEECRKVGINAPSTSHLSLIERGRVTPRPRLRAVLAELLDLPITYFDEQQDISA